MKPEQATDTGAEPTHWRHEGCDHLDFETGLYLRSYLTCEFHDADCWGDLTQRLAAKGFEIRNHDGCMALYAHPTGGRICSTEFLGYSMALLHARFAPQGAVAAE